MTADSARSRASGETIGQTSVPGSAPEPVVSASAACRSASRTSACRLSPPAITQTDPARQRWPAAPKAEAMIAGIEVLRSASAATIIEFFAPPSAWTRLPVSAERVAISRAVLACPTKETASTPSWSRIDSTASRPPCTRLTTPGGKISSSAISSQIRCDGRGSRSEGLRMNAFPQATA